jgi:nitroreductase
MTRDFLNLRNYGCKDLNHWMEKQTYMAVGLTMMAAAELGVEATPREGFDPTSVDKAFKIRETGHSVTVLLALGYPDPERVYTNPISAMRRRPAVHLHRNTHPETKTHNTYEEGDNLNESHCGNRPGRGNGRDDADGAA